jgi:hypothetical protein
LTRFSEELADIDTLFQNATSVLEDVWDEESAEEDDNLAGLELAEDQETHGTAMDLDGDDMLAQMEARLARLSSQVSHNFHDAHRSPSSPCRKRVLVLCLNQVAPTPTVPIRINQTTDGIGLITIVGNLVLLEHGVAPQHQEYLHDAIVSTSSSIHILYSPDVTEQGLDQLSSIYPPVMFITAQFDGADSYSHIHQAQVQFPLTILLHYIYHIPKRLNRIILHKHSIQSPTTNSYSTHASSSRTLTS